MNKNPAVQICWQLSDKEYQVIKKILTKDKRSSTLKLFTIIRSYRKKELTKEQLFNQLYKEPFAAEKDYLLRNELRLLRQKLDKYLLTTSIENLIDEDDIFRQKMMLYSYKKYKLYDLFFENYDRAEKATLDALQFDQALFLQNWYLDLAYQHQFSAVRNYEEKMIFFREKGETFKNTFHKYLSTQIRLQQFYEAMAGYYQTLLKQPPQRPDLDNETMCFHLTDNENPLSTYYHHRAQGFYTGVEERLQHFLQAYEALKNYSPVDRYIIDLLVTVLLGIGRCLQQLGDFEKADYYLSRAIHDYSSDIPLLASRDKLYSNYLINLLNIGKYEKAIQLLEELKKDGSDNGYPQYWYSIYRLIAYIGMNRTKEIKKELPVNHATIPLQHRIYFRIINAIYYYLVGEMEWAYKETYNLLHTRLAEEYGKEPKEVLEMLSAFFQITDKYSKVKNIPGKEIDRLCTLLIGLDTRRINDINILPVYFWLRNEVDCLKNSNIL